MTRLDRLILSEIIGPFVGSAFLFTGLFFAGGELVRYAEFLQKGEGALVVLQLVLYTFPMVIALTFPMAMLLATLLGFGRLSGDSEVTALVAAGVSFERIMAPVALFGFLISLLGYWISGTVVPNASRQRQAMIDAVKNKGGVSLASRDAFTVPLRDNDKLTLVHVDGGVDTRSATLLNISIEFWQGGAAVRFITAPRAKWVPGTKNWTITEGTAVELGKTSGISRIDELSTREVTLDTPDNLKILQRPVEEVTTAGLRERARVLRTGGSPKEAREADVEIARRTALPFASLMFALVGAPLGVRPQRAGKGVGFGLSVLITFVYWMALQVVSVLARGGILPPALALMLPNLVCLFAALYLIRRVLR
jgi:lipopolysaccharide export system permease protein